MGAESGGCDDYCAIELPIPEDAVAPVTPSEVVTVKEEFPFTAIVVPAAAATSAPLPLVGDSQDAAEHEYILGA